MSRIAKQPIIIPKGVVVSIDAQKIKVQGPKGQLEYCLNALVSLERKEDILTVKQASTDDVDEKLLDAQLGTARANISNLVKGVSAGYEKKLLLVGVGYRAEAKGGKINLTLGFSHPVSLEVPIGITVETPIPTEIIIKGANKHLVGQVAANIRAIRPVEPYKGKGVRYSTERVKLKETKKK